MNEPVCTHDLLHELLAWTRTHRLRDGRALPVCIWGDQGVGKTEAVRDFARRNRIDMRVYHPAHDEGVGELVGERWRDADTNATKYSPPRFLPAHGDHALAPNGILLIDEMNRADASVMNGLFELIGDGRISQSGYKLPDGWQIVACCNPPGGNFNVTDLDPALVDRMLHVAFVFDPDQWSRWATVSGLEEDIVRFVRDDSSVVHAQQHAKVPAGVDPKPTPRALEFFGTLYEPSMPPELMHIIACGLLGEEHAGKFTAQRAGAQRALSAEAMFAGMWRRYFPRWVAANRSDLLRDSVIALLRELHNRPKDPNIGANLVGIRDSLDESNRSTFIDTLAKHLPEWHHMVVTMDKNRARQQAEFARHMEKTMARHGLEYDSEGMTEQNSSNVSDE